MHNDSRPDWKAIAPCDAHMHIYRGRTFGWNLQFVRGYMEWFGIERAGLMALPAMTEIPWWRDDGSNLRCLGVKAVLNAENPARKVYAFAGLHLGDKAAPFTAEEFADQARRAIATGYDGFKCLKGKPGLRKRCGFALDAPVLDPFYSVLEENRKPLVMHVGDPADFWDVANARPDAVERGWVYDETFPSLAQVRAEAEGVLRKHPALAVNFAHVFFLGEDPDEAERLLETYPNLGLDLTPGWEMNLGFTKFHDRWHDIFERFPDRFYFGTDNSNWHASADLATYDKPFRWAYDLDRCLLGADPSPYTVECSEKFHTFRPLEVSPATREAALRGNFLRRYGAEPVPVVRAAAFEEAKRLLAFLDRRWPDCTQPDSWRLTLRILRRWTASPDALFAPEPFEG